MHSAHIDVIASFREAARRSILRDPDAPLVGDRSREFAAFDAAVVALGGASDDRPLSWAVAYPADGVATMTDNQASWVYGVSLATAFRVRKRRGCAPYTRHGSDGV